MDDTLVDTSVWFDFFRSGNEKLDRLLDDGHVDKKSKKVKHRWRKCLLGEHWVSVYQAS